MLRKTIAPGVYARLSRALWMLAAIMGCCSQAVAQQPCPTGAHVEGTVTDPSGAVSPGAQVKAADGQAATTDAAGHFLLACVPFGSDKLTVQADGFNLAFSPRGQPAGKSSNVTIQLAIAQVETNVQVDGNATSADLDHGPGTTVMDTNAVQRLADDPDDFLRQLQVLAAGDGGDSTRPLPAQASTVRPTEYSPRIRSMEIHRATWEPCPAPSISI